MKSLFKSKTYLIGAIVAVLLLVPCMFLLTACGESTVKVSTYDELANALAGKYDTIEITEDIDMKGQLEVGRKVTLNLNGKTLSNSADIWDDGDSKSWSLISVGENGQLTIKGNGKMLAKESDCYAFDVRDGGKLTIENGEFVGNVSVVYVNKGSAEIKGGKYSLLQLSPDERYTLNCLDVNYKDGSAKIVVTGGEFKNFNPANCLAEGEETNFVAEGYTANLVEGYYKVVKA